MVPTELLDVQKATVLDPTLVKMRAKVREAIALMADPYLSVCELRHEVSFSFFLSLSRYMSLSLSRSSSAEYYALWVSFVEPVAGDKGHTCSCLVSS